MKKVILCLFIISLLFGCAPKVSTTVTIPGANSTVLDYRDVAVFPFIETTKLELYGEDFIKDDKYKSLEKVNLYSDYLQSILNSSKTKGESVFSVYDRTYLSDILTEQNFQDRAADPQTIVEQGKLSGVSAVWLGKIDKNYRIDGYYVDRCEGFGKSRHCKSVACRKLTYNLTFNPQLIGVETGHKIYTSVFMDTNYADVCEDDSNKKTWSDLEGQSRDRVLNQFKRDLEQVILPKDKKQNITLLEYEYQKEDDPIAVERLNGAVKFASSGLFASACNTWEKAMENRATISILYNYTLCCIELAGYHQDALDAYKKIATILPPKSSGESFTDTLRIKLHPSTLLKEGIDRMEVSVKLENGSKVLARNPIVEAIDNMPADDVFNRKYYKETTEENQQQ